MIRGASRVRLLALPAAAVLAIACASAAPTISGRILDDRIELDAPSAPATAWLSLANRGPRPCRLMLLDTLDPSDTLVDPARLPVVDGRVVVKTTDPEAPGVHASEELYTEVDGRVLPLLSQSDRPAVAIEPGVTARVQLALTGTPRPGAVRILVCDDPGDYQRGRYAVLPFAG